MSLPFQSRPMIVFTQLFLCCFMVSLFIAPHLCDDLAIESQTTSNVDRTLAVSNLQSSRSSGASQERQLQVIVPDKCNVTLYKLWKQETYYGELSSDSNFWRYQTQPQIVLTNELALELSLRGCQRLFSSLYHYKAGRMGPITIQDAYKIMCRPYCLENDNLHQQAMAASGCSCIELSTPPDDVSYTKEGDWCYHNTGRLLCDMLGYCGIWNCRLEDFMCPRYEWNKKYIDYKGPGTCVRGSASRWNVIKGKQLVTLLSVSVGLFFYLW